MDALIEAVKKNREDFRTIKNDFDNWLEREK